eukprot:jgi/Chlat1/8913/Chrsp92S08238
MPLLTLLNESLQRSVEAVRHCQITSIYSLLWNKKKVTDRLNVCLQESEDSSNALDLANVKNADATHKQLTSTAEDLKGNKVVVAAEDLHVLVLRPQAGKALKQQLEAALDGLACLKQNYCPHERHDTMDARKQAAEGPLEGFICPLPLEIMRDPEYNYHQPSFLPIARCGLLWRIG